MRWERWLRAPRRAALAGAAAAALAALVAFAPARAWDAAAMQAAAQKLGPGAVQALGPLQALLGRLRGLDEPAQLEAVNQFFNLRIEFHPDIEVWNVDDYWASPLQALNVARGDCEDYVIAKYVALLAGGMSKDKLRLVYVRAKLLDQDAPQPHMVLAYYAQPGAEPLLLDNLRHEVMGASRRPDLTPVFSFNSDGLWQGVGQTTAGDPLARLSKWRDVWARIRQEGFLP